jgi:UTP--glucose-1-phosphate uridylyltransferase
MLQTLVSRYYYDRQPRSKEYRLSESRSEATLIEPFTELMREARSSDAAIASFVLHFRRLAEGERGYLPEEAVEPISSLPDSETFASHEATGRSAMSKVVIVKLNGGLGTSMGLDHAKSLLPVRNGLSFLDLIARQVLALRAEAGSKIPLVLMNSFRTATDSERVLSAYPDLALEDLPHGFLQNRVPKVLEDGLRPAVHESRPELGWCPPGHGDFYTAIRGSGLLDTLLDRGFEYAFISNADNLGAAFDPSLLGYMVATGIDFMLEAADRTAADRKGGHLCTLSDGRLALRESAQCPPQEIAAFQDVRRYRYFNTNNLWIHLPTLDRLLDDHGNFLPLPTVVNQKTLDPRNPASPQVFQLETVMGTAITLFPRAAAVRVNRRRFSPVKNTNDLLGVRSDAYELEENGRIALAPGREEPPVIQLDEEHFKIIDRFEERFAKGAPSLIGCDSLRVVGDVTFGANVRVKGRTVIRATNATRVPDGTLLSGDVEL